MRFEAKAFTPKTATFLPITNPSMGAQMGAQPQADTFAFAHDPDLSRLIKNWPNLLPAIRRALMAIVESAK
jgi:hypothetical protein